MLAVGRLAGDVGADQSDAGGQGIGHIVQPVRYDSDGTGQEPQDDLRPAQQSVHDDPEHSGQPRVAPADHRVLRILVSFDECFPDELFHN